MTEHKHSELCIAISTLAFIVVGVFSVMMYSVAVRPAHYPPRDKMPRVYHTVKYANMVCANSRCHPGGYQLP